MTETQKYLYADSDRQTEHVNRLEWQVFTIFSICNFMIVFVAFLRGYRTAAFTGTTFLISAVTVVAMLIAYLRQARQQQNPLDITGGTGAFDTVYDHCL